MSSLLNNPLLTPKAYYDRLYGMTDARDRVFIGTADETAALPYIVITMTDTAINRDKDGVSDMTATLSITCVSDKYDEAAAIGSELYQLCHFRTSGIESTCQPLALSVDIDRIISGVDVNLYVYA